jgi:hypothetical protein
MVRLEELEDEHFVNKPEATADGALLADDDEDFTDTGMSLCSVHIMIDARFPCSLLRAPSVIIKTVLSSLMNVMPCVEQPANIISPTRL